MTSEEFYRRLVAAVLDKKNPISKEAKEGILLALKTESKDSYKQVK